MDLRCLNCPSHECRKRHGQALVEKLFQLGSARVDLIKALRVHDPERIDGRFDRTPFLSQSSIFVFPASLDLTERDDSQESGSRASTVNRCDKSKRGLIDAQTQLSPT